MLKIITCKN